MNKARCGDILMAKMAEMDGEESGISAEQLELHLADCDNCRVEFGRLRETDNLLKWQVRREQEADLWPAISGRIESSGVEPSAAGMKPFLLLGAFLFAYKFWEILPESDFGYTFKIIPVLLVAAVFVFLKENPFKINTELTLER